jgi:hypothetical protein
MNYSKNHWTIDDKAVTCHLINNDNNLQRIFKSIWLCFNMKDSENIDDYKSILIDAVIMLANTFKQAGCNPPKKIEVDQQTFDKMLAESIKLYNIDTKKVIISRQFSLSDIIMITEEKSGAN